MSVVGFIGLGRMGAPMAANLAAAGHTVRGWDISQEAREAAGIEIAERPAEGADVVITMLQTGEQVLACVREDVIPVAKAGALLVDCSTIDVFEARAFHETAEGAGLRALDAPVSGGVVGAEAATLTFMVGGDHLDAAAPLFDAMGRRAVHCGAAGAGQAAKACNNMLLGISMIGVSEAFALADALGLSHQALFDVASTSSGQCWSLTTNCPVPGPVESSPANRDYEAGFAAALMLKDLRLATAAAEAGSVDTELGRHAAEIYERVVADGDGRRDFSVVYRRLSS